MCCTVMCCRYPLLAEAGQQAGQQQGAGDAGQSARYHRHGVAEGGRARARFQVTDPRAAGDHGGLQPVPEWLKRTPRRHRACPIITILVPNTG